MDKKNISLDPVLFLSELSYELGQFRQDLSDMYFELRASAENEEDSEYRERLICLRDLVTELQSRFDDRFNKFFSNLYRYTEPEDF